MSEELETEVIKPKRQYRRKDKIEAMKVPLEIESEPCPVCDGTGQIQIEEEDETGEIRPVRVPCDFCGGSGVRPVGPFEPDDVTDEDIAAIERSLGYTSKAWGFIDERMIIAAAANRMGRKPVPA